MKINYALCETLVERRNYPVGATRLSAPTFFFTPMSTIQKLHLTKIIMRNFIIISLRKNAMRGIAPQRPMLYYVK